jgi:aldehyde dehydrogenase (NAD+)
LSRQGFWVPPTILAGVANSARVAQEEIFGPVVAAIRFEDEAEAVAPSGRATSGAPTASPRR